MVICELCLPGNLQGSHFSEQRLADYGATMELWPGVVRSLIITRDDTWSPWHTTCSSHSSLLNIWWSVVTSRYQNISKYSPLQTILLPHSDVQVVLSPWYLMQSTKLSQGGIWRLLVGQALGEESPFCQDRAFENYQGNLIIKGHYFLHLSTLTDYRQCIALSLSSENSLMRIIFCLHTTEESLYCLCVYIFYLLDLSCCSSNSIFSPSK